LAPTSIGNRTRNVVNILRCASCYVDFPAIDTLVASVPPGIVNMLGQFQTWRLLEAEPIIRTFMAAVAAAGAL
jgi:hypothetical protein